MKERAMNQQNAKKVDAALDGFDGYEDRVEGEEQQTSRVIQGEKWRFTENGKWMNDSDEEIPPDRLVTVVDICRVVQKWVDHLPVETEFVPPGERIPDLEKRNAACPDDEWTEYQGKQQGPWQFQNIVYMVDENMKKITYPTSTVGGGICVRELADQVANKRKIYGTRVYPKVAPAKCWMNTQWKGRDRPSLKIVDWIVFGSDGGVLPPEPPSPPELPATPSSTQPETTHVPKCARIVSPEAANAAELDDEIPF
jgi:hypothetical protein